MCNTNGDVAPTNYSQVLVQYSKQQKFFAFPQLRVCTLFLNFGHFQPHVLTKKVFFKKKSVRFFDIPVL